MTGNVNPALLIVVFIALFALIVFNVSYQFSTLSYLEKHHRSAWVELGCPSIVNQSIYSSFTVLQFLITGRYKALGDPVLNTRCRNLRIMMAGSLILFIGLYRISPKGGIHWRI